MCLGRPRKLLPSRQGRTVAVSAGPFVVVADDRTQSGQSAGVRGLSGGGVRLAFLGVSAGWDEERQN